VTTIHHRTVELIPWYVNGSLPDDERHAVERHVAECLPCRAALRDEERLGGIVRAHGEMPLGTEHGISDLLQRIDAGRPGRGWRPAARVAWGAGLVAAVAVTVAVLPVLRESGDAADSDSFSTLTEPRATDGLRLDIFFEDALSDRDRDEIVRAAGATLVGGPTELGRYTIAIDPAAGTDVDSLIEDLSEDSRIRFVGRNFIDSVEPAPEAP